MLWVVAVSLASDVWLDDVNTSASCLELPFDGNATVAYLGKKQ